MCSVHSLKDRGEFLVSPFVDHSLFPASKQRQLMPLKNCKKKEEKKAALFSLSSSGKNNKIKEEMEKKRKEGSICGGKR